MTDENAVAAEDAVKAVEAGVEGNIPGAVVDGVEAIEHVSILHKYVDDVFDFIHRIEGKVTPAQHEELTALTADVLKKVDPQAAATA